jgi:hypothetical protein
MEAIGSLKCHFLITRDTSPSRADLEVFMSSPSNGCPTTAPCVALTQAMRSRRVSVDAKCVPSAKHKASQTSWLHTCKESQDVPVNFPWKLTKDKVVKYQSLELAGWYQTVPYLRLQSQTGWHIAIESYLPINWNHSGAYKRKKQHSRMSDVSMTTIGLCLDKDARAQDHDRSPWWSRLNK